jgi:hypothetical protein
MKTKFAGIPQNQERRARIEQLISADVAQGNTTGIESVRMHFLVGDYLKEEREGKSKRFRKRKTCKNKEHSQPCFCLNLKRFQDKQQNEVNV